MTKKESDSEKYMLEWENNIKGRPLGYREEQIISSEEWESLGPREKVRFTHLTDEEKRTFVKKLRTEDE